MNSQKHLRIMPTRSKLYVMSDKPELTLSKELSQASVLVIDVQASSLELMSRILRRIPVGRCITATSAEDALYNLNENPQIADVIVTECKLAGMSGVKFLRQLRTHENPKIRVIPVIGVARTSSMKLYRGLAAFVISAFIVKPVSESRLKEAIELALSGYRVPVPGIMPEQVPEGAPTASIIPQDEEG